MAFDCLLPTDAGKLTRLHRHTMEITFQHQSTEGAVIAQDNLLQLGIVLNLNDIVLVRYPPTSLPITSSISLRVFLPRAMHERIEK